MICIGILWNGMETYVDEAIEDISQHAVVHGVISLDLKDDYEKFVREIYAQDEIAEWKVNKKIETMFQCSDSRTINIVFLTVDDSEKEYHPFKKRIVCKKLEAIKTEIRGKYSQLVTSYFFDNVLHVTDDERELEADFGVLERFIESLKPSEKGKARVLKNGGNKDGTQKQNNTKNG